MLRVPPYLPADPEAASRSVRVVVHGADLGVTGKGSSFFCPESHPCFTVTFLAWDLNYCWMDVILNGIGFHQDCDLVCRDFSW